MHTRFVLHGLGAGAAAAPCTPDDAVRTRVRIGAAIFAAAAAAVLPFAAVAHVKWFSQFSYGQHVPAHRLSDNMVLWVLLGLATVGVWALQRVEGSNVGHSVSTRLRFVQHQLSSLRRRVFVGGCIFYFTAVATVGNVILTPELVTESSILRWLQAAAAIALFFRSGEPLAGAVFLILFGVGLYEYGFLHMLDYVLFLGPAIYFLAPNWPSERRVRALRIATSASLMWVAVEKWVYPDWVMQIVHDHPVITFGFPKVEFVVLAGVVEFALAFGLLWRGLYSVISALGLIFFLSAAILEFGYVDLVGHIVVLSILIMLALDRHGRPSTRPRRRNPPWTVAALFFCSCVSLIAVYHGLAVSTRSHPDGQVTRAVRAQTVPVSAARAVVTHPHPDGRLARVGAQR